MFSVSIKNALFNAPIGLYPQESKTFNQIAVDLQVSLPSKIDNLPFVDYTQLYDLVKNVILKFHKTLEEIVSEIYNVVKSKLPESTLSIKVRKHHPPISGQVDYTEVAYQD